jgi:hypothetical protein
MAQDNFLRMDCYLCGNSIEFPGELANHVIVCPHCQKGIKLFIIPKAGPSSVPAQPPPAPQQVGSFQSARQKDAPQLSVGGFGPFNLAQAILTGIALTVFLISIFNAPWELSQSSGDERRSEIVMGPIFAPPSTPFNGA